MFRSIKNNSSILFFSSNTIYFGQNQSIKVQIFKISSARVKIWQIPQVSFELASQFHFNFCIIFHCHDT